MYQQVNSDNETPVKNASYMKNVIRGNSGNKLAEQGSSNYNPSYVSEEYLPRNMELIPKVVNKSRHPTRYISSDPRMGGEVDSSLRKKCFDFLNEPTFQTETCGMGGCEINSHRNDSEEMVEKIFPKNDLSSCPLNIRDVYLIFSRYYEELQFTKIKNTNEFSLYAANIQCGLGKGFRYVILTVPRDGTMEGFSVGIDRLMWVSLQTRYIEESYNLPKQNFNPKIIKEMESEIILKTRNEKITTYKSVEYPINISLLNINKSRDYSDRGNIRIALETYQTIVTMDCS